MKRIPVSELKPGMRFSKPVYLDKENLFITSNSPVTDSDIDRLRKFGIKEVHTSGEILQFEEDFAFPAFEETPYLESHFPEDLLPFREIYESLNKSKSNFLNLYRSGFQVIQDAYRKASEDKPIDISPIREVAEQLTDYVRANTNVSYLMFSLPISGYYLYNHVVQATVYSLVLATLVDYSRPRMIDLAMASLFADIGMVRVPSAISEKSERLSEEEQKILMKHPVVGYQMLTQKIKIKSSIAIVALQHHERFDGTGYPQKLYQNNIEENSRIYAIGDNFSALTNTRPHRQRLLPHEAIKNMISIDVGKFDLKLIRIFLNHISMFPVGSGVELSDGRSGIVLAANSDKPLRPVIRIMKDAEGSFMRSLVILDLMKETQLYINRAVNIAEVMNR